MKSYNLLQHLLAPIVLVSTICSAYSGSAAESDQVVLVAFKKYGESRVQYFSKPISRLEDSWTSGPEVEHRAILKYSPNSSVVVERIRSSRSPDALLTEDSFLQMRNLRDHQINRIFSFGALRIAIQQAHCAVAAKGIREGSIEGIQVSADMTAAAVPHQRLQVQDDSVDLWLLDARNNKCVSVSDGNNYDEMPAWSPDGTKLAFYRTALKIGHGWGATPEQRGYALWVWDRLTGKSKEIAPPGRFADLVHYPPVWSPDSTKVLFTTGYDIMKERLGVYVVANDGAGLKCLSEQDTGSMTTTFSYEFSPDGTKVLYTWRGAVCLVDADGTNRKVILPPPHYNDAIWSRNGDRIVVMSYPSSCFISKPDGSELQALIPPPGYKIYKALIVD